MKGIKNMTNKTSKTGRKNKTNLTITWPAMGFFNHEDLKKTNPEFVDITLRVRIKAAVENGTIKDIGILHNGKGRPKNVYSININDSVIENAKKAGVTLHDQYLVEKITDITNTEKPKTTIKKASSIFDVTPSVAV
jgi:hypothetical protein